ncbi:MAG: hypothetical protein ACT4PS_07190 [Betaproteobacteria bacterium]
MSAWFGGIRLRCAIDSAGYENTPVRLKLRLRLDAMLLHWSTFVQRNLPEHGRALSPRYGAVRVAVTADDPERTHSLVKIDRAEIAHDRGVAMQPETAGAPISDTPRYDDNRIAHHGTPWHYHGLNLQDSYPIASSCVSGSAFPALFGGWRHPLCAPTLAAMNSIVIFLRSEYATTAGEQGLSARGNGRRTVESRFKSG